MEVLVSGVSISATTAISSRPPKSWLKNRGLAGEGVAARMRRSLDGDAQLLVQLRRRAVAAPGQLGLAVDLCPGELESPRQRLVGAVDAAGPGGVGR